MQSDLPTLRLRAMPLVRIKRGHPWIYSNELEPPPAGLAPGDPVDVETSAGEFVGRGYFNRQSQIQVRLLTQRREPIDADFFTRRIKEALTLRERLFPGRSSYRLVYSEGDRLPGLIADRYGDVLVLQLLTAGMERLRDPVLAALIELVRPGYVLARNDAPVRRLEGLPQERVELFGKRPEGVVIDSHGLRFELDIWSGQKTGFFLDQAENYAALREYAPGARVLDACCYTGAWGLHAARFGAKQVLGLDSSAPAVAQANKNATANGLADRCRFETADLFTALRELGGRAEQFDLVILDPPAFAKSKEKLAEALRGYREINRQALRLLVPGGVLVSCSCSYQVGREAFLEMLQIAARDARRAVRLLEFRGQSRDHPVLVAAPEGGYLKCAVLEVCAAE